MKKMMLLKCCTQYASKFGKLRSAPRWQKGSFHTNAKEKNAKECSNYCTIALISHASKIMLKILQAKLQRYVNWKPVYVQAGFRKARGIRDQIAKHMLNHRKKKGNSKIIIIIIIIYFSFIDYSKAFDCVDHNKLENS